MTPAARVQAAIDILDSVIEAARSKGAPADRIIADWARANRYAGSKDRRAVRELVYDAIRACGPIPSSGRAAMLGLAEDRPELRDLFTGEGYGPAVIADGEPVADDGIAPEWLEDRLIASGVSEDEALALLGRAPLDIRVNTLKASRENIELPEDGKPLDAPNGLRFAAGTNVEQWPAFREGHIEIQDHGSQWACHAVAAKPGETIIDLCAGAGGKTLSLAAAMDNSGTLIASDTDKRRLGNLPPRAERAGAGMIETLLLDPGKEAETLAPYAGKADAVLIDAPCSGAGTWRRNPEARWRLDEKELARLSVLQSRLLRIGASLVRRGGRLIYVTCSLLDEEGARQIDQFLAENAGWQAEPLALPVGRKRGKGTRLTPSHDGTDGFFIATLSWPC